MVTYYKLRGGSELVEAVKIADVPRPCLTSDGLRVVVGDYSVFDPKLSRWGFIGRKTFESLYVMALGPADVPAKSAKSAGKRN